MAESPVPAPDPSQAIQVKIIRLVDANKAKLAFLLPLVGAIGSSLASWIVSGDFNGSEIRAAAGGTVLAVFGGLGAWIAPAREAVVQAHPALTAKVAGSTESTQ